MSRKQWRIADYDKQRVKRVAAETGFDEFSVLLLETRGITGADAVGEFLSDGELDDPFAIKDMSAAAAAVRRAVDEGVRITVYGDYDADGVTATALLYSFLQTMGANVDYYIPSRLGEGYGLHNEAIDVLKARGTKLIITVDNGISSIAEADYIYEQGMELIVTDHHTVGPVLPRATAVVNPHRPDDKSRFKELAGVGVAFKLALAVADEEDREQILEEYAQTVAIGTIADIVDLTGENRVLVKKGLELMDSSPIPAVAALAEKAFAGKTPGSTAVSFMIAPRINAAGRMGKADTAVKLLLSEDDSEADFLADELEQLNVARQETESEITASAVYAIENDPSLKYASVIVVAGRGWHAGVIGIVASRLTEKYSRPAMVISVGEDGVGSGSCRSINGFSMYDALAVNSNLLLRFGGHTLAAGFAIREEDIPRFRARVNEYADTLTPFNPTLDLDCRLNPASVGMDIIKSFSKLEPFGAGNRQPVFALFGMKIGEVRPLGQTGKHIRLRLERKGVSLNAVMFGVSEDEFPFEAGDVIDAAVNIELNEYRGEQSAQTLVRAVRPSGADDEGFFDAQRAYRSLKRGDELTDEKKALVCPDRTLAADVFRYIRRRSGAAADPEAIAVRLGRTSRDAAKVRVALDAFCELGIMETVEGRYSVCVSGGKRKLSDAPVLRRLGYTE